jgi:NAD(P)-dependent dehydrogenase (short-subunit alcohol dehydrogenase family)
MGTLENKVALVTGAGRGLGRACAQIFAREGAKVVIATRTAENGEETLRLIEQAGGEAIFVRTDVSKSADVRNMVRVAVETFGGLDCAINNAVHSIGFCPLADIGEDDWERALSVNFTGVFLCLKYEIPAMLERGRGAIVNVGSGNEHTAMRGLAWFLGAKQGVYGMTKVAALDYGGRGIRLNAVAPGPMLTPVLREAAAEDPGHLAKRAVGVPLGRVADPEEVAEVAVWLCSPAAAYVHGHTMSVDGGFVLSKVASSGSRG